jgi:endonuclease/exonuclease/phosphatase family metal-dependent hydrolase
MEKLVEQPNFSKIRQSLFKIDRVINKFLPKRMRSSTKKWSQRLRGVLRPSQHIHVRPSLTPSFHTSSNCITVLSANLWHDWPFKRRLPKRLESFASLVESEGADIVLLQEVFRTPEMSADGWLAERLGMSSMYSRVNGDEKTVGFEEGLAIFSRFPMFEPKARHLGMRSGVTRRLALASEVRSHLGNFLAISVHLGLLQRRNRSQMTDLSGWVGNIARGRAALIGGDFNAHENSHQITRAQQSWVDTFRSLNPVADAPAGIFGLARAGCAACRVRPIASF